MYWKLLFLKIEKFHFIFSQIIFSYKIKIFLIFIRIYNFVSEEQKTLNIFLGFLKYHCILNFTNIGEYI